MPLISGPEDAYRILVEESEENWLRGLLAFAIVEEQRIEWAKHFERHNERPPDTADVRYEQQPDGVLRRTRRSRKRASTVCR